MIALFLEVAAFQYYLTLTLNLVLKCHLLPAYMSMVLDKDVLFQGHDEQVCNLIIHADNENFDFLMMDIFTK